MRLRLVLRGFMALAAFDVETRSGTGRRSSQRRQASEAACRPDWILASLGIDKAFLKGLAHKELAEAIGEKEKTVRFTLPPGSFKALCALLGFSRFDESQRRLRRL